LRQKGDLSLDWRITLGAIIPLGENAQGVEQEVGMWEKIGTRIVRLRADRTATAALEYGIIAAILGLNLINLFMWWGSTQGPLFQHVGGGI